MLCNIMPSIDDNFFCMSQCPISNSNVSNLSGIPLEISGLRKHMNWDIFLVLNGQTNHEESVLLTDLMYVQAIPKKFFTDAN